MQLERGNADLERILNTCNIHVGDSLAQISHVLRTGVVKEWLGENSHFYQVFMTEGQLQAQAKEFLQDGVYSLDIGDLVIAALSNMLHTSVVIFTSSENQPLHIQHPTYVSMMNPFPIYVAYLQTGPGHYDAVVPSSV